jgi:hypothetical protein
MHWMWERYGADFANEDGEWKIWNLHTYTDFGIPVSTSYWADASTDSMVGTGVGGEERVGGFEFPEPVRPDMEYHVYSYRQVSAPASAAARHR